MNRGLAARRCYYCGATRAEAAFPGNYKPRGRRDRCASCIADPLWPAKAAVQARRAELATPGATLPYSPERDASNGLD